MRTETRTVFHIESKTDAIDYNHLGEQGPFVKIANGNYRGTLSVEGGPDEVSEIETILNNDNLVVKFEV